ncbi:MAG: galactokinase family protein [Spirochaetales bacterium]
MNPKLEACHEVHHKEYGTAPAVLASAPGKVSLLGDHTEFAKGFFLSAAISRRVYVTVSSRSDALVRFHSREYNERKKTAATNLKFRKEDRWANYPKGVLAAFAQQGVRIDGLDLSICGDIPQGIGLGSSQALCLASAFAFNEFFGTGFPVLQLIQMAQKAETAYFAQGGESLPATAATSYVQAFGQEDELFFLDTRSFEWENLPFPPEAGEMTLINSRVPSSSFDSSSGRARAECEACLRLLATGRPGRSLRDYTKTDLRDRVGTLPESARRRSLHVIDEMSRAQEALESFREGDFASVGRLMNRSHESLRDLYEVSCPEIDWLVKRLQETDLVTGARMTGEESGGAVLALARPEAWKSFKHQSEEYERIFGFKAELISLRPSAGAQVHQLVQMQHEG